MSVQLLVQRLLPSANPDTADRSHAWNEWLASGGYEPVLKFIRWSNGTDTDDEEILQDTLIIAYVKVERGQYQDRNLPFTAFLKKIAWYKIMEASRKEAGLVPLDDLYEVVAEDHHEHERVEFWKEHEVLKTALAQLPPRARSVIVLHDVEGFTHAEIGELLDIPGGTARSDLHHARQKLRGLLGNLRG